MAKQNESKKTQALRHQLSQYYIGSYWWKTVGSAMGVVGLPDLFGCVHGHLYGIEVKIEDNWFSRIQIKRLRDLHKAGCTAGGLVWKDNQWWWVRVSSMGFEGDHRRAEWLRFRIEDLIFFRLD